MPIESLSPELVYANKGNIAYPATGGIDGVATAATIAGLAQKRLADAVSGDLNSGYGVITTGIGASTATTTLAVANGVQLNAQNAQAAIPSGAVVAIISGGNVVTTTTTAAAAQGATSVAVSSFTVPWAIAVGAEVVWGEVAASMAGAVVAAQ